MDSSKTCGQCTNWHLDPIDINNLTAPRIGECRGVPPTPVGVPTQQGLQVMLIRPKMAPDYAACGQFQTRSEG